MWPLHWMRCRRCRWTPTIAMPTRWPRLASASGDHTARIGDVADRRLLATLQGPTDHVWSLDGSPDSRWRVSGSGDYTARIWETDPLSVCVKPGNCFCNQRT